MTTLANDSGFGFKNGILMLIPQDRNVGKACQQRGMSVTGIWYNKYQENECWLLEHDYEEISSGYLSKIQFAS